MATKLSPITFSLPVSCGISSRIIRSNWRLLLLRLAVRLSMLCKVAGMAGSANMLFSDTMIESSLGSIFSSVGIIAAALPKAPSFILPMMVSPYATFSRGLLAKSRFSFTEPNKSLCNSAVEPLGIRKEGSTSISATTLPGCT